MTSLHAHPDDEAERTSLEEAWRFQEDSEQDMTYLHIETVEEMIKAWQAECAAHPALYNQGNVLRDRLSALAKASQPYRSGGVALNSTQDLLAKMAGVLEQHGIDIPCPWDGDLSDEEQERFAGLVNVLDVVEKAVGKPAP